MTLNRFSSLVRAARAARPRITSMHAAALKASAVTTVEQHRIGHAIAADSIRADRQPETTLQRMNEATARELALRVGVGPDQTPL